MSKSTPVCKIPKKGTMKESAYLIYESLLHSLSTIKYLRIGVTLFMVSWLGVMTYLMTVEIIKTDKEQSNNDEHFDSYKTNKGCKKQFNLKNELTKKPQKSDLNNTNEKPNKIQQLWYLHSVWFGDRSIVEILFNMWIIAIMIIVFLPVLTKILDEFKTGSCATKK